jgi:hypothetical protein
MDRETTSYQSLRKPFNWMSTEAGKREYAEFMAHFQQALKDKSWVLSDQGAAVFIPDPIGEEPAGAQARAKWLKEKEVYDKDMRTVYKDFLMATELMVGMFHWNCMARNDINMARARKDADGLDLDYIAQFRAARDVLKTKYAPSGIFDASSKRLQLQQANDQGPEGFYGYQRQFSSIKSELIMMNHMVDADSERTWAFLGIKNQEVCDNVTIPMKIRGVAGVDYTADDIFEAVTNWLTTITEFGRDPYKTVISKSPVTANKAGTYPQRISPTSVTRQDRCTRCWGPDGHKWTMCKAIACAICGTTMKTGDQTCPAWRMHDEPYKFKGDVEPWNRSKSSSYSGEKRKFEPKDQSARSVQPHKGGAGIPDVKTARKIFNASLKAAAASKKRKSEEEE